MLSSKTMMAIWMMAMLAMPTMAFAQAKPEPKPTKVSPPVREVNKSGGGEKKMGGGVELDDEIRIDKGICVTTIKYDKALYKAKTKKGEAYRDEINKKAKACNKKLVPVEVMLEFPGVFMAGVIIGNKSKLGKKSTYMFSPAVSGNVGVRLPFHRPNLKMVPITIGAGKEAKIGLKLPDTVSFVGSGVVAGNFTIGGAIFPELDNADNIELSPVAGLMLGIELAWVQYTQMAQPKLKFGFLIGAVFSWVRSDTIGNAFMIAGQVGFFLRYSTGKD